MSVVGPISKKTLVSKPVQMDNRYLLFNDCLEDAFFDFEVSPKDRLPPALKLCSFQYSNVKKSGRIIDSVGVGRAHR